MGRHERSYEVLEALEGDRLARADDTPSPAVLFDAAPQPGAEEFRAASAQLRNIYDSSQLFPRVRKHLQINRELRKLLT